MILIIFFNEMLGVSKQTRINARDVWVFIFKWM